MATKKDLVEAQGFSRRRLLTAFVSGAPGGQELEPTKPLRAVVAGVALTVLLVVGGFAYGLIKPELPKGWDNNSLVVTSDGGSRYVALNGVLYPVLNVASARLLIPADAFQVVQVDATKIAGSKRGTTVGISGAPDELPGAKALISSGWLACTSASGATAILLSNDAKAAGVVATGTAAVTGGAQAGAAAVLVQSAGDQYLVTNGRRYLVPRAHSAGVLRAIGQDLVAPWQVSARWLNLFPPGTDLDPIDLAGAGARVPAGVAAPPGAVVGSVLAVTDGASDGQRYVVDPHGDLAELSVFAAPLYRLGAGAAIGADIEVTSAQIAGMRTARDSAASADWPTALPGTAAPENAPCAQLLTGAQGKDGEPQVRLVFSGAVVVPASGTEVHVQAAGGALVRAASGAPGAGPVLLIDQTGTLFPVPDTSAEMLKRLGFVANQVTTVPAAWLGLFPSGPALTEAAAGGAPQASASS